MENQDEIQNEIPSEATGKADMFFLEVIKVAVLLPIIIFSVRHFLFKPFYVKGESMVPNFLEKEYLIIDELTYRLHAPKRGEVIVFRSPVSSDFYLKRVVGLPGERVKIEDNHVVICQDSIALCTRLEETYLVETTTGSADVTLEPGEYFVMGDNRDVSFDSRRFGAIGKNSIVGRVYLRGWPFSRAAIFQSPPTYNL